MTDPNFLLIGAQKAGTTWLAAMLRQHPEIFLPERKELHFFNLRRNYERGIDWYRAQFAGHRGESAVGECTPNYLWVCDAPEPLLAERRAAGEPDIRFQDYSILNRNIPELVQRHYPDLKLIVSLRNPVERAISRYYHAIKARKFSPRRRIFDVGGEEGILGMGFYQRHLSAWFERYPPERFLILIYEEDLADERKPETLRRIFRHLDISDEVAPDNLGGRFNERRTDLYLYLNYYAPFLARRLKRYPVLQKLKVPPIRVTPTEVEQLGRLYESENRKLEELLGRPLDAWRPAARATA